MAHRPEHGVERRPGNLRRSALSTVIVLGVVITIAGANGVFAVFTDRATTGTNSYSSAALPRAADLQLAVGTVEGNSVRCPDFVDDLQTGIITQTDGEPGSSVGTDFLCVKNVGSKTVAVTASAINVDSREVGDCTGDEQAAGDTTCLAAQAGELSARLDLRETDFACDDASQFVQTQTVALPSLNALALFALPPDSTRCLTFSVTYNATEDQALISQSDIAVWRFAFDGTTSS